MFSKYKGINYQQYNKKRESTSNPFVFNDLSLESGIYLIEININEAVRTEKINLQ